ncbi:collagen-like triple helix repeat-containing protein [Ulvibacterium sp.]|uniref:collagen-like triple helix repeat-containing protein n=1 Tax=Ulvibacterium sp. TaxID=2665914 RepID=UPI003CC58A73
MKTKRFIYTIIPLVLCAAFAACSAEDGADGATGLQGPQGEQGPPGADGRDGQDGIDGQDGTANVFSSGWFEIDTWDTDLSNFKFHRIPDLILTEFQRENNVILVYRRYQPVPTITTIDLLPFYELNATSGGIELAIQSKISGNGLFLQVQSFGRALADEEFLGPDTQFRYIIIEPDPTSDKNATPNFSKMSYEEVIAHLGLHP